MIMGAFEAVGCKMQPQFSITIITACFNAGDTIDDTLRSVQSQNVQNCAVEHIVKDGGSDDDTKQRVAAYDNVRFVSTSDTGIYDALNQAVALASGDIIGLLHANDFYADNDVLQRVCAAFADDEQLLGVYADLNYVSDKNVHKMVRHWQAKKFSQSKLRFGWMPPHPTLFLRRSVYEELGGFNTKYKISADYDFILRLFSQYGARIAYVPALFVLMRTGGKSNRGLGNLARKSWEDYQAAKAMGLFAPLTIASKILSKIGQIRFIL